MDRTKVTFAQAEGRKPLPAPLNLEELSQEARAVIWRVLHRSLDAHANERPYTTTVGGPWSTIVQDHFVFEQLRPIDEFVDDLPVWVDQLKAIVFSGEYWEVLDFLQWLLRHRSCPGDMLEVLKQALIYSRVAYRLIDEGPTFMPAVTVQEGDAIAEAIEQIGSTGIEGASGHLQAAGGFLVAGKYADSVRESIHSVESVACQIDPDSANTLDPALKALAKHGTIHPALQKGFSTIYGYTSDADGVRHKSIEDGSPVDQSDAVFMLGACASFVTYLINKGREAGLIEG